MYLNITKSDLKKVTFVYLFNLKINLRKKTILKCKRKLKKCTSRIALNLNSDFVIWRFVWFYFK